MAKTHLARVAAKRERKVRAVEKVKPTMTKQVKAGREALTSHKSRAKAMLGPIIVRGSTMDARLTTASLEDKACPVGRLNIAKRTRKRSFQTVLKKQGSSDAKGKPPGKGGGKGKTGKGGGKGKKGKSSAGPALAASGEPEAESSPIKDQQRDQSKPSRRQKRSEKAAEAKAKAKP